MLKGYVTYISAALMIVTGILQLIGFAPEVIQTTVHGWELIMMGLTVFGVGRKIQTLINK